MMRYRFLAIARREYLEAVRWYRDDVQDIELAQDFIASFRQRLERIQRFPHSGALVIGFDVPFDIRRAKLKRFPFHIFFTVRETEVIIIAITHEKRRPGHWTDRIDDV
ncbi:MAG: type II toxin-antitoxin system RelE/ParE family toxin [Deltaproteobacteria bacterium]|nr:type II toxin-antitoxin system RelE/ParE family toxin [Deltaproteobacteria bacterium]